MVKNPRFSCRGRFLIPGWGTMATHSSILAWRIPWTEEPDGLQSMGSQSRTQLSDLTHSLWGELRYLLAPQRTKTKTKDTPKPNTCYLSFFLSVNMTQLSWVPLTQGHSQTCSQGVSQGCRHVKAYRTTKYIKKKKKR